MNYHTIVCPSCGTGNRVPDDREGLIGRCGKCRNALPPLYVHPVVLTDLIFDNFIRECSQPVLVEFWAPW